VVFKGNPPKRKSINMSGEAGCRKGGGETLSEEIIVGSGGGLRNVYVRVVVGLGDRLFAPPETVARMDQRGCVFEPHVLPVQTNQIVTFTSSDQLMHNVRAVASDNPTFNISMSGKGRTVRRFFPRPEIVRIRCDIHAWMAAYIPVSEHPFYNVTGDDGSFRIAGLPAGAYQVEAWHESLGSSSLPLTLPEGGHGRLEFSFSK
jgi:plastocyanin